MLEVIKKQFQVFSVKKLDSQDVRESCSVLNGMINDFIVKLTMLTEMDTHSIVEVTTIVINEFQNKYERNSSNSWTTTSKAQL